MKRHLRPLIVLALAAMPALAVLAPGPAGKPADADVSISIGLWLQPQ